MEQIVDHLFLLVGANPLPNYIAAKMLAKEHVHLLYSDDQESGIPSTKRYADMLQRELRDLGLQVTMYGIHDASALNIRGQVDCIIEDLQQRVGLNLAQHHVGLNYTGATKPMAVHVHRALSGLQSRHPLRFSYLDPRRLSFWFDDSKVRVPVSKDEARLSLQTLARLHGYDLPETDAKGGPRTQPQHLPLARAILEVHKTPAGFQAWREWLNTENKTLPADSNLEPVIRVFQEMCADQGYTAGNVAGALRPGTTLDNHNKWFLGQWLEELALEAIQLNTEAFGIQHYGAAVHPKPRWVERNDRGKLVFDLDVAALIGYQLFAISCIVSQKKGGETKKHLLEAYVRARQLGGEEARVALVYCGHDAALLERELKHKLHVDSHVKVFGLSDIENLASEFKRWFHDNS